MRGLGSALRMESVRLRTVRSTWVLALLTLLLSAGVALVLASATRGEEPDPEITAVLLTSGGAFVPLPFAAVLMAVLGVLTVGHDYRHGLVRPVLAAVPARSAVVVARLLVLGVFALLVTVLSVVVNALVALLVQGAAPAVDAAAARAVTGYLALALLWTWLGAGATWLLRSTAAVLTALFLLPLVVEPLIQGLSAAPELSWLRPVADWLPFAGGRLMVLTPVGSDTGVDGGLGIAQGATVFTLFVAVLLAAGWSRFSRADA